MNLKYIGHNDLIGDSLDMINHNTKEIEKKLYELETEIILLKNDHDKRAKIWEDGSGKDSIRTGNRHGL